MWGLMSSGTQCFGGDGDVGLNVFRADVLGTPCLGETIQSQELHSAVVFFVVVVVVCLFLLLVVVLFVVVVVCG